jgi:3-oxoacyl-[acyl-carrier-protein] synthase II
MLNSAIYIVGIGSVSAQGFDEATLLQNLNPLQSILSHIKEPNYSQYIEGNNIRRMGKLMKASLVAAKRCIADAQLQPQAIITGTGLGCMEETVKFLNTVIDTEGGVLSPTAFIHSTHNTIGSQIAIAVNCTGYNSTYVHRAFSFEQALFDAQLQLLTHDPTAHHVLVGGVDDMVPVVFDVLKELDFWKSASTPILDSKSKGSFAGEGMNFLMLSNQQTNHAYAKLLGIKMCYKPQSTNQVATCLTDFLLENKISPVDIDLVLLGDNGDMRFTEFYNAIISLFPVAKALGYYKHLCGEYFTASAFGVVLASLMLKNQYVSSAISENYNSAKPLKNILLYNQFQGDHHSFCLLQHVEI